MRLMRSPVATALVVLAVAAAAPATAQIYKWKDAKGVTNYSESPPAGRPYTVQESPRSAPTPAPATGTGTTTGTGTATTAASSNDPRCDTARKNVTALQGKSQVTIDANNDGKPDKTLSDAERASELEMARATLKAYNCTESAATGAGAPPAGSAES